jgi:acetyl-CoA carboxylase carboxyltransferase component
MGKQIIIACMDFTFIGGSVGSVVGEKIVLAINKSIDLRIPLLIISKSGGARMMEGAFSLMQLAKTIFSPTTEPTDPPIKVKSIHAIIICLPIDFPIAVLIASL